MSQRKTRGWYPPRMAKTPEEKAAQDIQRKELQKEYGRRRMERERSEKEAPQQAETATKKTA